jgi:hypothetical protein
MTDEQVYELAASYCVDGQYRDVLAFAQALTAQYKFFGVWGPTGETLYVKAAE